MAKSEDKKMATLAHFQKRFNEMDAEKSKWLAEWDTCDVQYEAEVYEQNNGKVNINNPLEQDLVEMETGRTAGRPVFDVIPDPYDPNPEQVDAAKYILDSFLDREGFIEEYRQRRIDKSTYGTGIFYTGLRYEINDIIERDDVELEDEVGNGFFSSEDLYDNSKEEWFMTPMNVSVRHFWADDSAFYQPNFRKAKDCIMLETLSKEEFHQRYKDNKHIVKETLEAAQPIQEDEPEYGIPTTKGLICIYHYFNRVTKEYSIIVNKTAVLFEGKMIYRHGKLPFVMCQHYPNNRCLYGYGICRKVRVSKAYLNNVTQALMDGARMAASKVVTLGNSGEPTDGDIYAIPGGVTMARFTNSLEQVGQIDTQVNLNGLVSARGIINDMVRTDTGIDMNAPFEAPAEQLGTVEIIEQNKAIRYKTPDEARDHALDTAFEMTLSNISQFAPTLLKRITKVKDDNGKVIKEITKRPQIQIKNVKITKKKGTTVIEEDYGNYGYLELKSDTLNGEMSVRVITPNTHNQVLKIIEKNRAKELVANYAELSQIFGPDKLMEMFPLEEVIEKLRISYGYDKQMTPISKKKATIKENEEKIKQLQELLSSNPSNVGQNQMQSQGAGGVNNQIQPQTASLGAENQNRTTELGEGNVETTGGAI